MTARTPSLALGARQDAAAEPFDGVRTVPTGD
jgi:hypothetical protein